MLGFSEYNVEDPKRGGERGPDRRRETRRGKWNRGGEGRGGRRKKMRVGGDEIRFNSYIICIFSAPIARKMETVHLLIKH